MNIIIILGYFILACFVLIFPIMAVGAGIYYSYLFGWYGVAYSVAAAILWYWVFWIAFRPRKKK